MAVLQRRDRPRADEGGQRGIDRLLHLADRGIRRDEPEARRRADGREIAELGQVEARGRIVFISGMTARRPDGTIAGIGDVEAQTRQVCENIKAAIEAAGHSHETITVPGALEIPGAVSLAAERYDAFVAIGAHAASGAPSGVWAIQASRKGPGRAKSSSGGP